MAHFQLKVGVLLASLLVVFGALAGDDVVPKQSGGGGATLQDVSTDTTKCEAQYSDALKVCQTAEAAAQEAYDDVLARSKDCQGSREIIEAMLAKLTELEADLKKKRAECKALASQSSEKCGKAQDTIKNFQTAEKLRQQAETFANAMLGTMVFQKPPEEQVKPFQTKVTQEWWKTDDIHAKTVPHIDEMISQVQTQKADLEMQKKVMSSSFDFGGDKKGATPAAPAPDQRTPVAQTRPNSPSAAPASATPPQNAQNNPNQTATPAEPQNSLANLAQTPSAIADGGAVAPAGGAAVEATEAVPPQAASNPMTVQDPALAEAGVPAAPSAAENPGKEVVTSDAQSEKGTLPELPPLPPSSSLDAATVTAAGNGLSLKSAVGVAASSGSAKSAGGVAGFSNNSFGGGSSSPGHSWLSSLTSRLGSFLGFGSGQGRGTTAAKANSNVDLSQFLPGQRRDPASSIQGLGIHGPNVNFFGKVNERYHSLEGSFDP